VPDRIARPNPYAWFRAGRRRLGVARRVERAAKSEYFIQNL
jgi:hypothetical protein